MVCTNILVLLRRSGLCVVLYDFAEPKIRAGKVSQPDLVDVAVGRAQRARSTGPLDTTGTRWPSDSSRRTGSGLLEKDLDFPSPKVGSTGEAGYCGRSAGENERLKVPELGVDVHVVVGVVRKRTWCRPLGTALECEGVASDRGAQYRVVDDAGNTEDGSRGQRSTLEGDR